jgi:hypothetical protein
MIFGISCFRMKRTIFSRLTIAIAIKIRLMYNRLSVQE